MEGPALFFSGDKNHWGEKISCNKNSGTEKFLAEKKILVQNNFWQKKMSCRKYILAGIKCLPKKFAVGSWCQVTTSRNEEGREKEAGPGGRAGHDDAHTDFAVWRKPKLGLRRSRERPPGSWSSSLPLPWQDHA